MRGRKPLTDEEGEVRELLIEDLKRFRPAAEVLSSGLTKMLGVERKSASQPGPAKTARTRKNTTAGRKASQARRQASD